MNEIWSEIWILQVWKKDSGLCLLSSAARLAAKIAETDSVEEEILASTFVVEEGVARQVDLQEEERSVPKRLAAFPVNLEA